MADRFVSAPLVIAKRDDGSDVYLYEGAQIPALADGEVDRLDEGGFLADVEKPAPKSASK